MGIQAVLALFFVGMTSLAVMLLHPIGPAITLLAVTPFDAIPFALYGWTGNIITYIPILLFLIRVSPVQWGQIFLGTRIQQLVVAFLLLIFVSHAIAVSVTGMSTFLQYARKLTLLLLLGIFAWSLRSGRFVQLSSSVFVASMALFSLLSMLDFYLGIQIMPVRAGDWGSEGALGQEYVAQTAGYFRFAGAGFPINRYANWLIVPIFLGIGWLVATRGLLRKIFAAACTGLLLIALAATVSRSTVLAVLLGGLVLAPMVLRLSVRAVAGAALVVALLGGGVFFTVGLTEADAGLTSRFSQAHVADSIEGRWGRVVAGLTMFVNHPIAGIGNGLFVLESMKSREQIEGKHNDAHNAFIKVLAEAGVVGFVPFVALFLMVTRSLLASVKDDFPEIEFWRPYFLAAFTATMVSNLFMSYAYERPLWFILAFAVTLEQCRLHSRAAAARQRRESQGAYQAMGLQPPVRPA